MGLSSEAASANPKALTTPWGVYYQRYFEAVDPLGLGGTPPEASLPAEKCPFRDALTLTMAATSVVSKTH